MTRSVFNPLTPRTYWDREGNLWAVSSSGLGAYLLWHHEYGEDWVTRVSHPDRILMCGCDLLELVFVYRPLVASC